MPAEGDERHARDTITQRLTVIDLPTASAAPIVSACPSPPWFHPWIRLHITIRAMRETLWGDEWPTVKAELGKALKLRDRLRRAPWWN
jgi:hypothetical protein